MQQSDGASVNVGAVHLSLHSGSCADAPLHFTSDGVAVDQLPPTSFIGPATVIDVGDAAIHALHASAMVNLEHLDLSGVVPGTYQLVAFPLRLEGLDASPVRAVLVQE